MPLEEVEQLMQDSADAKAYEDSLRQMLGKPCLPGGQPARHSEIQSTTLRCLLLLGLPVHPHASQLF